MNDAELPAPYFMLPTVCSVPFYTSSRKCPRMCREKSCLGKDYWKKSSFNSSLWSAAIYSWREACDCITTKFLKHWLNFTLRYWYSMYKQYSVQVRSEEAWHSFVEKIIKHKRFFTGRYSFLNQYLRFHVCADIRCVGELLDWRILDRWWPPPPPTTMAAHNYNARMSGITKVTNMNLTG
jgi:hypothetical protein